MASRSSHNKNNAGVKRILQEARELAADPSTDYHAAPLEDDIFEWHCTIRGPAGTEFEGGIYHFRIQLPSEYPFRPPSIMMLTPNGRFELNTKAGCLSLTYVLALQIITKPAWGVRTAIIGLQGFFPLKGETAVGVGAMECTSQERKRLAKLSRDWSCPRCGQKNIDTLPDPPEIDTKTQSTSTSDEQSAEQAAVAGSEEPSTETSVPFLPVPPIAVPEVPVTVDSSSGDARQETVSAPQPILEPGRAQVQSRRSRPPLLLDGAIAVCLTMLVALLWKRIF
ncbi:hypothetical protein M422DRAFT_252653 [Sphaerobolus stellatus SS14]|uniref:UBC core domain-containing protein n=1 Tax=Sphaerobolus stellatus (strain SS14) TaxID=990650 RepID=A0A0C9VZX7_SPHS4|nr:hypothetical protein M422DRAFT_252653 [Sphaerobolus stellatus SS14]